MTTYINAIIVGVAIGSIYGLIGLGYTVGFNATRVVNFAHGDLVMVGVLLSYWLLTSWRWPQLAVLPVVVVAVTALALVEERIIIRPFVGKGADSSLLGWVVSTLGFGLMVETVATKIWGNRPPRSVPSFVSSGTLRMGGVLLRWQLLVPIGVLIVATLALQLFYRRSTIGWRMRASADDPVLGSLRTIESARIGRTAFMLSGALAGVTGFAVGPIVFADPDLGLKYGLVAFVALAMGGFGSIPGALLGAVGLGIAQQLIFIHLSGQFEDVATLVVLSIVLLIRPSGLLSQSRSRSV
ncbi:MAG: branched-chain amino acid ABC transporter permease [Frankia sp.]